MNGIQVELLVVLLSGLIAVALGQTTPQPDKGDTAFMFVSTDLVLFMTIPGLALFYGGLVRSKNMISVLMQVFAIVCAVMMIWVFYGYSLAFTQGGNANHVIGGFSKAFLRGVTPASVVATFSNGVVIYEYEYILFQMTFACITPALIVGAFAERVKFSALMIFCLLWSTFCYLPIAHMVWYWAGPDAIGDAAKELASATSDAAKAQAQSALDRTIDNAGLLFKAGALDFAGGTVVHINAGIAGFVGALIIGKRIGYGTEDMAPHSLTMTMIGASMLWVGWFGFNCGSNLEANGTAIAAMVATFLATAAAGLTWMLVEWIEHGKPTLLGLSTGVVAGLVAITPASGFAGPMGSIVLGAVAAIGCYFASTAVKRICGYDDSLDVFGVHAVGGIIGALGTAIVAAPSLYGSGVIDYAAQPGTGVVAEYNMGKQFVTQMKAVAMAIFWSGLVSTVLFLAIDKTIGLRPNEDEERMGLDLSTHGEKAYYYGDELDVTVSNTKIDIDQSTKTGVPPSEVSEPDSPSPIEVAV